MTPTATAITVPSVPRLTRGYEQVADHYRSLIRRGRFKPDADFPSVRDIAETWGISTNTAYRAVKLLRDERWIELSQGKPAKVVGVPGET